MSSLRSVIVLVERMPDSRRIADSQWAPKHMLSPMFPLDQEATARLAMLGLTEYEIGSILPHSKIIGYWKPNWAMKCCRMLVDYLEAQNQQYAIVCIGSRVSYALRNSYRLAGDDVKIPSYPKTWGEFVQHGNIAFTRVPHLTKADIWHRTKDLEQVVARFQSGLSALAKS